MLMRTEESTHERLLYISLIIAKSYILLMWILDTIQSFTIVSMETFLGWLPISVFYTHPASFIRLFISSLPILSISLYIHFRASTLYGHCITICVVSSIIPRSHLVQHLDHVTTNNAITTDNVILN